MDQSKCASPGYSKQIAGVKILYGSVYSLCDVARLVLSGLGLLNPALGKSEELPP